MAVVWVTFDATVLGEPIAYGLWCRTCAIPSGIAFTVLFTPRLNPAAEPWRMTVWRCVDCGGDQIDPG